MKGDTERALALLMKIDSPYRPLFLGEFLVNSNRFKEAIDVLARRDPSHCPLLPRQGVRGRGQSAMAGRIYKELIPYAGTYPEAYQRIGMTLGRQGEEGGGYEYLGRYYLETGRDAAARTNLEKAVAKYGINAPESAEILKLLDMVKDPKKNNRKHHEALHTSSLPASVRPTSERPGPDTGGLVSPSAARCRVGVPEQGEREKPASGGKVRHARVVGEKDAPLREEGLDIVETFETDRTGRPTVETRGCHENDIEPPFLQPFEDFYEMAHRPFPLLKPASG